MILGSIYRGWGCLATRTLALCVLAYGIAYALHSQTLIRLGWQLFRLSHLPRLDSLHIHTILTAITCLQALNIDFMGLDGAGEIPVARAQQHGGLPGIWRSNWSNWPVK